MPFPPAGSQTGHRHEGLGLGKGHPPRGFLLPAEGEPHKLGEGGAVLLGLQLVHLVPLQFQSQVPRLVIVDRGLPLHPQASQVAAQLSVPMKVGGKLGGELRGGGGEDLGQGLILPAYRPPAFLQAALILLAVTQGGELLVGRAQEGREADTSAGKPPRVIPRLPLPLLQHGREGVVQGVVGADGILSPTGAPQRTAGAHPLGGPVKDPGRVGIVLPVLGKRRAQTVPHLAKGPGSILQPSGGIGGAPLGRPVPLLPAKHSSQLVEMPLGQKQKAHRGQKGLVEGADPGLSAPAPGHGHGVGHHIGDGPEKPPLPPGRPGEKSGKAVGHGVEPASPGHQVHSHAHRNACGGAPAQAAGMGRRHHQQHPQPPSQGNVPENGQSRQSGKKTSRQKKEADGLPGRKLPLPGLPRREGNAEEVGRSPRQNHLGNEKGGLRHVPIAVA